jgi:hypothetical protein
VDSHVSRPDVHLYRENEEIAKEEVEKGCAVTEAEGKAGNGNANPEDEARSIKHRDDNGPAREKKTNDNSFHPKEEEVEDSEQGPIKESNIQNSSCTYDHANLLWVLFRTRTFLV